MSKQEVDAKLDEWKMLGAARAQGGPQRVGYSLSYSVKAQLAHDVARPARDGQSEDSRVPGFRGFRTRLTVSQLVSQFRSYRGSLSTLPPPAPGAEHRREAFVITTSIPAACAFAKQLSLGFFSRL